MAFFDGQNVFKACRSNYGHGYVHPLLLAHRVLAGRTLCGARYYSGLHHPRANPALNAVLNRRHALMRRVGLDITERPLRYRWEWGITREEQRNLPGDPREHKGDRRTVEVSPYQRPREKGIDLALGLDVVDLALQGKMDVAVIFSSDTDLVEVARVVHQMTLTAGSRVSVEAAVFNEQSGPILLKEYDYTHQLKRVDFNEARDGFNYSKELDPVWRDAFVNSCAPFLPVRD